MIAALNYVVGLELVVIENKFHIRVKIEEHGYLARLDNFCENLVSEYTVARLGLKVEFHPYPYTLYRYNEKFWVTKQACVDFSLGSFIDTIMCDIIPMDDCHIYLGKPSKYLNKAVYDYDRDVYHINSGRKTLRPLSTDQVVHDMGVVKRMVQKWLKSQREEYHAERANEVKVVRVEPKQAVVDNLNVEKSEKIVEDNPENLHKKNDAQVVVEDVKDNITHEKVVE